MLFHPAVIALLLASAASLALIAIAAGFGLQILRRWDISSGSALQLRLERRTYLIATLLGLAFLTEIVSLLLYVFNADQMAGLFVGAMCAVGSLNVNAYGFPALMLKMALFFAAALWLFLNAIDNQARTYPLIRTKYALLLIIAPLAGAAGATQLAYFMGLEADVITSCCGALFSPESETLAAEMSGWPPGPVMWAFFPVTLAASAEGVRFSRAGRGGAYPFAFLGTAAFFASVAAIISFLSLYLYEHPHHHCAFCMLKPDYDFLGYLLYIPLFTGAALALGSGALWSLRRRPGLEGLAEDAVRRAAGWGGLLYLWVLALSAWIVFDSNLLLLDG